MESCLHSTRYGLWQQQPLPPPLPADGIIAFWDEKWLSFISYILSLLTHEEDVFR